MSDDIEQEHIRMILTRVPQRRMDDCSICATAMVLDYPYERVDEARSGAYLRYAASSSWWEHYLEDEGYHTEYLTLDQLDLVMTQGSNMAGLLHMQNHEISGGHLVAIDEIGVLDPASRFPDHVSWQLYNNIKMQIQHFVFDTEFLAVSQR